RQSFSRSISGNDHKRDQGSDEHNPTNDSKHQDASQSVSGTRCHPEVGRASAHPRNAMNVHGSKIHRIWRARESPFGRENPDGGEARSQLYIVPTMQSKRRFEAWG